MKRTIALLLAVPLIVAILALCTGCCADVPLLPTSEPTLTPSPTPEPKVLTVCMLDEPDSLYVYGTNSVAAMQSGIIFGYVGLIEGIVARMQKELGGDARVIATGGLADVIARETEVVSALEPDLTLVGLRLIYEMNAG